MNNERFTSDGWNIYDGDHRIGMIQASKLLNELYNENQELKRQLKLRKTTTDDIIGIVKTEEVTNSVELKKELYK